MLKRLSIAKKVFGLAVLLLCLTVALACFLLWHVDRLQDELEVIARREVPLAASLSRLDEYGLRQRLAFERWFGALNSRQPNQQTLAESQADWETFTQKLKEEFDLANHILKDPGKSNRNRDKLAATLAVLNQIEAAYPIIQNRQRQVINLQTAGQHDRASDLDDMLNDLQRQVQAQRRQLQDGTAALVQDASDVATAHEKQAFVLSIAMTISAVLLGLTLSAVLAHRLAEPVRTLIAGLKSVENGDLSVELPVCSQDEVGALTQSFNYFVGELRAKEDIKRTFGQYIDPRVLEQVILQPGAQADGRRVMTVSFCDIVGFTGISEHLTATGLVNLLNRHFTLQAEAVQREKGVIDKFIGDAVLAFWGPPFISPEEHPLLACRAALGQLQALQTLRAELPELTGLRKNLPSLDARLGISTGEVVVGNIGSESARSYTVIGDTVNLGQRLEGANRLYGTRILISGETWQAAGTSIISREIDYLLVKGKTEPARAFELLGLPDQVPELVLELCQRFAVALEAYRSQQWDLACKAFQRCLELVPDDGPSRLFLERSQALQAQPPSQPWDGVWRLTDK